MEQKVKREVIEKTVLPHIKNIIIVTSGKGGVGKSTVASGMAVNLALEGYAVGLLDADIYGPSVPTLFNIQNQHPEIKECEGKNKIVFFHKYGIKVMSIGFFIDPKQAVLWRGPLASNALKQLINDTEWGPLDYLIIDTPPGTGDIHITLLQQYMITGAVIVTTPQLLAMCDVKKAIDMYLDEHVGVPIYGIVENMSWFTPGKHPEEKYYLFGKDGGEKLASQFNLRLLAQIPVTEDVCNNCDEGKLDILFRNTAVKKGFESLTDGIISFNKELSDKLNMQ